MAEKKIGSRYFKAGEVLATDAIKLQIRLIKLIGGAVDKLPVILAGAGKDASDEAKVTASAAATQAMMGIFEKADPDEIVRLMEDTLAFGKISYTGKGEWDEIVLDQEFSGPQAKELIPALLFILQEALGDFFSGLPASGALGKPARD